MLKVFVSLRLSDSLLSDASLVSDNISAGLGVRDSETTILVKRHVVLPNTLSLKVVTNTGLQRIFWSEDRFSGLNNLSFSSHEDPRVVFNIGSGGRDLIAENGVVTEVDSSFITNGVTFLEVTIDGVGTVVVETRRGVLSLKASFHGCALNHNPWVFFWQEIERWLNKWTLKRFHARPYDVIRVTNCVTQKERIVKLPGGAFNNTNLDGFKRNRNRTGQEPDSSSDIISWSSSLAQVSCFALEDMAFMTSK